MLIVKMRGLTREQELKEGSLVTLRKRLEGIDIQPGCVAIVPETCRRSN